MQFGIRETETITVRPAMLRILEVAIASAIVEISLESPRKNLGSEVERRREIWRQLFSSIAHDGHSISLKE